MKKIGLLFLIVLSVFLITGCGSTKGEPTKKKSLFDTKKTMTCTKEEVDEDGYKTSSTYKITYTSKKVTKVDSDSIMEMDSETIDWVYTFGQAIATELDKLDGITASYTKIDSNKIEMKLIAVYDKIDPEQVKEALGGLSDDTDFYTKTDITVDEFIKQNLEGFTCK
ncbi:MAG: hypothetical protein IKZ96_00510 [Bacilli bacterium]|nr:hypothetical protein [Bacilli bacterium]